MVEGREGKRSQENEVQKRVRDEWGEGLDIIVGDGGSIQSRGE